MISDRSKRLQARFKLIQQAVVMTRGRDMAFAAASVGWLEAIEYTVLQALRRMEGHTEDLDLSEEISMLHQEIKALLQSFHKEMCEHIAINQTEAIEASSAFKEVVSDICNQRG